LNHHTRARAVAVGVALALATAATGLVGVGSAGAQQPKGTTITIGSVATETGGAQSTGKVTINPDTLNAWVKWTNAHGGIAGHPVKAIVMDDKADPAQASSILKQLVEDDHVAAIVGQTSTPEPTFKTYIEAQRVPVIGGTEYSANWFTSPMFYPVSTTVISNIYGFVKAASDAGAKKLASLLCSNSTVCQGAAPITAAAAKSLGMDVVYNQLADAQATSYTPQCLAMKEAGADVVSPQGVNNVTLIRDCTRQNYKPLYVTTNWQYSLDQIKSTPQFNGLIGAGPTMTPYSQYSVTKDRDAALKKYAPAYAPGGKQYNTSNVMIQMSDVWEAAEAFKLAVERSGVAASANVTPADVIKGLATFKNETLGGSNPPLTYSDGTQPNPQVKCFYIYKIKAPKYVDSLGANKLPKVSCQP
jgi:branched-chain amino acid transport system substrate-binding protein